VSPYSALLVRRLLSLVVVFALSLLVVAAAAPAPLGPGATRISGDSPFPRCSARDRGAQRGAETEPHLAVAPDGTLLAAWHQDRRTTGGSMALGVARSSDGGRRWSRPQRLTAQPMRAAWLPETTLGRMLADYVSISFSRRRPVPVFALASEPRGGLRRQAIFATTRLR
jgi:hypothetical protein